MGLKPKSRAGAASSAALSLRSGSSPPGQSPCAAGGGGCAFQGGERVHRLASLQRAAGGSLRAGQSKKCHKGAGVSVERVLPPSRPSLAKGALGSGRGSRPSRATLVAAKREARGWFVNLFIKRVVSHSSKALARNSIKIITDHNYTKFHCPRCSTCLQYIFPIEALWGRGGST